VDFYFLNYYQKYILVAFTVMGPNFDEFKWGGESLEQSQRLLEDRGEPRDSVSRWPVAGPSGYILTSSEQCGN
jgi:hypothetical protein